MVPFNLVDGKLDSEIWETVQDPFEPLDFIRKKNEDIFDLIQDQIPTTEVFRRDTALRTLDREDFDDLRELLDQHINQLFVLIGGQKFHFWTTLIKRGGTDYRQSDEAWYKVFDKLPGAMQVIESRLEMARKGDQKLLKFCNCTYQKYQRGEVNKGHVSCYAGRCFFGRKAESYFVG
ncbi:hypothetical protein ABW20_dc0101479 [Dactylellina cionopaga]|nr:hypothetical protein ABW20_dc0101479 [Dactylellina cionopaga]